MSENTIREALRYAYEGAQSGNALRAYESALDALDALVGEAAAKDDQIRVLSHAADTADAIAAARLTKMREAEREAAALCEAQERKDHTLRICRDVLNMARAGMKVGKESYTVALDLIALALTDEAGVSPAQPACDGSKFCKADMHIEGCFASPAQPAEERRHQALGICWCGGTHSMADAVDLNQPAEEPYESFIASQGADAEPRGASSGGETHG